MEMSMNDVLKAYFDKEGVSFKAMEVEPETYKEAKRIASFLRSKGLGKVIMEEVEKGGRHYGCIEDWITCILMRRSNC